VCDLNNSRETVGALKQMRVGLSMTTFRACPALREVVIKPPYAAILGNCNVVSDKEKREYEFL